MERVMGIEPTSSAWEAEVLPLNHTRQNGDRSSAVALYYCRESVRKLFARDTVDSDGQAK